MDDILIKRDVKSSGWSLSLFRNPDPVSIVFEDLSGDGDFLEILPEEIDYYCELLQGCKRFFNA